MRQEKLAGPCQHKLESDKKNPLKRRKHRAKTVRCFPLLSAFGSRFWSTAFSRLSCRGPAVYEPAASIQYIHSCSRFGSRFGSSTFAARLACSYARLYIIEILIHCDFPGKQPTAHLFAIVRDLNSLHVQRHLRRTNRLFNKLPHKCAPFSCCF